MPNFKPFKGIKPNEQIAANFVSNSVDKYTQSELDAQLNTHPFSFLQIIKPTWQDKSQTATERHDEVRNNFDAYLEKDILQQDASSYYIYQVINVQGKSSKGLLGLIDVDDYLNDNIKKHEAVLSERVQLFAEYLDGVDIHAEPVLLTYNANQRVDLLMEVEMKKKPHFKIDFEDGSQHFLWRIQNRLNLQQFKQSLEKMDSFYIADGHHRMASSAAYTLEKRKHETEFTGQEAYNFVLALVVSDEELIIKDYNRLIKDLGKHSVESFLEALEPYFEIIERDEKPFYPSRKHHVLMYLEGKFYSLFVKKEHLETPGLSELDTYIFEESILKPILNIQDSTTDKKISFLYGTGDVGGIEQIKTKVDSGQYKVGFAFYPVSVKDIVLLSEMHLIMPPKSTYIEPKPLSGMTIYDLKD